MGGDSGRTKRVGEGERGLRRIWYAGKIQKKIASVSKDVHTRKEPEFTFGNPRAATTLSLSLNSNTVNIFLPCYTLRRGEKKSPLYYHLVFLFMELSGKQKFVCCFEREMTAQIYQRLIHLAISGVAKVSQSQRSTQATNFVAGVVKQRNFMVTCRTNAHTC